MHKLIIVLAVLITFTSCFKERIDIDNNTEENKKIVITGWITSLEEPQFINISRTVNYLGGFQEDKVSGAVVTLQDGISTYTMTEKEAGTYYLPDDWVARLGDDYNLKVVFDNKEYTATHTMTPCPEMENIYYDISEDYEEGEDEEPYFDPVFSFQETEGEGDAYYAVSYPKGTLFGDSLIYGAFASDDFSDGIYFEDIYLPTGADGFFVGDTAVMDFYSIGLETASYLQDIENEIYRGSPFDAPPANVRTNIEGGAIGYFIASGARREEIVIE